MKGERCHLFLKLFVILCIFKDFCFERERERESAHGHVAAGGAETEGGRIPGRLCTVSEGPDSELELTNRS